MEEKLPFSGDIVRTTSVRRLNKLYFAYTDLSPEVQPENNGLTDSDMELLQLLKSLTPEMKAMLLKRSASK